MSNLWEKAQQYIPGGVNSPVRAFKSVGCDPVFIQEAKGAYVTDNKGKQYIDYVGSWGPMILGHSHPDVVDAVKSAAELGMSFGACCEKEVEFAELLCNLIPGLEQIRMVSSGTEATMSVIRLARGFTGREKFLKFKGCYHGHGDSFLIAAGSGALTHGTPNSKGVTTGAAKDTLLADYNNIESVRSVFESNPKEIAAVILEPIAGNMGTIVPAKEFILELQKLCSANGTLLIFDEVMTGFRVTKTGAQGYFDVIPDLYTFGKIIGAGLPVGAFGGRKEIMSCISPLGGVYQAGTLSGNPLAMAAGLAAFKLLGENSFYETLNAKANRFNDAVADMLSEFPMTSNGVNSMSTVFFTETQVKNFDDALTCDTEKFGRFFRGLLEKGVYIAPSQFEAGFISAAHSDSDLDQTVEAMKAVLKTLF